jgi:hypothetical protein
MGYLHTAVGCTATWLCLADWPGGADITQCITTREDLPVQSHRLSGSFEAMAVGLRINRVETKQVNDRRLADLPRSAVHCGFPLNRPTGSDSNYRMLLDLVA